MLADGTDLRPDRRGQMNTLAPPADFGSQVLLDEDVISALAMLLVQAVGAL